ncbi:MAG: hypothetical protein LBQ57_12190 [Spirochaetales bacterium]|jgi:hypothetical protein|nr:hypothetical protein [Spirochaetales bacterium]
MGLALAAVFFYLFIPGLGAFFIRSRWRGFRKSVIAALEYPEITYKALHSRGEMAESGHYHFLGVLEAIQEDDVIWLRNDEVALSADMKGQKVFLLPSQTVSGGEPRDFAAADTSGGEDEASFLSDETPQVVAWGKVRSLPEGIHVLLAGTLHITDRKGRFRSGKKGELLVIFYDGDNASLLKRAVWHGRQRNEYWNPFTGVSLAAGFLTGMSLSYFFLSTPINRIPAILSIIISLIPLIPVLPPGMVFFVLYRRLWRRGRFLRAQRDILKLPRRQFGNKPQTGVCAGSGGSAVLDGCGPPDMLAVRCEKQAVRFELLSLVLFLTGFAGNLYLVLRGLALLI